jgi:hypothetical protein
MAVVVLMEFEPHEAEDAHDLSLALVDLQADSTVVEIDTPNGPFKMETDAKIGATPQADDVPDDTPIKAALAINIGPLTLKPGRLYGWQVAVDGAPQPEWTARFATANGVDGETGSPAEQPTVG